MKSQTFPNNHNAYAEKRMHELHLSAQIVVTDTTGTEVTIPDERALVRLIAQRHHTGVPVIELHNDHQQDRFFHIAQWHITEARQITEAGSENGVQRADYRLRYINWQVTATNGTAIPIASDRPGDIAQDIADRSQVPVVLTSQLPGVRDTTYAPISTTPPATTTDPEVSLDEFIETLPAQPEPTDDTPTGERHEMESITGEATEPLLNNGHTDHSDNPDDQAQELTSEEVPTTEIQPRSRREARESFLTQKQHDSPATTGWRGSLRYLGIRLRPSAVEQAERDDVHAVSQRWPGPRTIAVVNGKGGSNKTPTTICLSAIFARYGGGGVLAWDNNQFRGTLGWRTEQAGHDHTILDLLPQAQSLLATGAQSADLAYYVHHQTEDRYDVLRSKPRSLADQQRFDQADVDSIHRVTSKFFRIIIIDSGNDESDPMWRRMIDHTDQLVVATTTSGERSEAAALLLEDLESTGTAGQKLADESVVVVSQAEATAKKSDMVDVVRRFKPLAREVAAIPYDPAMVDGPLSYSALRPDTQRAWLAAGAAVARGL